jgi:hypothetical protein
MTGLTTGNEPTHSQPVTQKPYAMFKVDHNVTVRILPDSDASFGVKQDPNAPKSKV